MPGIHLIVTYSANKTGMEINLSTHTYYQNQKSSQRMIGDCEGSRLHTVDPINFQVWNVKSLRIEVTPVTSSQKKKLTPPFPFLSFLMMISKQQHKPSIILLQEKLASRSFFSRIRSKLILVPMNTVRTLNYVLVRQCVREQGGDSGISSQASTQRAAPAAASEVRPEQSGDEAPQLSECRR
jgi:hypothetical protein